MNQANGITTAYGAGNTIVRLPRKFYVHTSKRLHQLERETHMVANDVVAEAMRLYEGSSHYETIRNRSTYMAKFIDKVVPGCDDLRTYRFSDTSAAYCRSSCDYPVYFSFGARSRKGNPTKFGTNCIDGNTLKMVTSAGFDGARAANHPRRLDCEELVSILHNLPAVIEDERGESSYASIIWVFPVLSKNEVLYFIDLAMPWLDVMDESTHAHDGQSRDRRLLEQVSIGHQISFTVRGRQYRGHIQAGVLGRVHLLTQVLASSLPHAMVDRLLLESFTINTERFYGHTYSDYVSLCSNLSKLVMLKCAASPGHGPIHQKLQLRNRIRNRCNYWGWRWTVFYSIHNVKASEIEIHFMPCLFWLYFGVVLFIAAVLLGPGIITKSEAFMFVGICLLLRDPIYYVEAWYTGFAAGDLLKGCSSEIPLDRPNLIRIGLPRLNRFFQDNPYHRVERRIPCALTNLNSADDHSDLMLMMSDLKKQPWLFGSVRRDSSTSKPLYVVQIGKRFYCLINGESSYHLEEVNIDMDTVKYCNPPDFANFILAL